MARQAKQILGIAVKLKVLDLFSGIGGFSLGLERAKHDGKIKGFETVAFCEIEEFPRKVLAKRWPKVPCYQDVRTLTAEQLIRDGIGSIDVITGGFPCQDISTAGKQAGINEGTRSGLWSEIVRLAGELRPQFIIVENVANLLRGPSERPGAWFGRVLGDLAALGYDAEWHCIPASELGAHHHRDRVWIMAYATHMLSNGSNNNPGKRLELQALPKLGNHCRSNDLAHTPSFGQQGSRQHLNPIRQAPVIDRQAINAFASCVRSIWATEPSLGRVANGIPDRSHRLKGLGNAVVPQIPELIGDAILESINT